MPYDQFLFPFLCSSQPEAIFHESDEEEEEDTTDVPHWTKKPKLDNSWRENVVK